MLFTRSHLSALLACGLIVSLCSGGRLVASVPTTPPTFTTPLTIDNPVMPFEVDGVQSHRGRSDGENTAVVALFKAATRDFSWGGGTVATRILQETEFEAGVLSEISQNFFAQADDGTVYYFGEVVDIYEDGLIVSHDGSWLVGGGTLPGDPPGTGNATDPTIFMPGNPEVGDQFKPEDLFPLVDETVTILAMDVRVRVEAGRYRNAMKVRETSDLPDSDPEKKWYVPGLGPVRTKAEGERLELIASTLLHQEN